MKGELLFALTVVTALGSALMAGAFFAFSTFVMKALARLAPAAGMAAMQSINIVVINPLFLGVFLGTAAACAAVIVGAPTRWEEPGAAYLVAGGVLYVARTFGITVLFNVPLNNSLAAVGPADADAMRRWESYVRRWTAWNHVRTVAALAAVGAFILALRR